MVFSLFGKKDKTADFKKRKDGDTLAPRRSESPARPASDPREDARRTVQKIDEIEQQMNLAQPRTARPPAAGAVPAPAPSSAAQDAVQSLADTPTLPSLDASTSAIFGDSRKINSLEIGNSGVAPVIEEAAILYANKQGTAAAMILWQAIKDDTLGAASMQAWLMLFDLYQVLGRKREFESLALDYAARFETSPPNWNNDSAAPVPPPKPKAPTASAVVTLTPIVDLNVSRHLEIAHRAADKQRSITIDCSQIRRIDPDGAQMVLDLMNLFEQSGQELRISATERLCAALRTSIEPGRRDESQACWNLLLYVYRIARDEARYDEASIDFCVTYEVSPPQWKSPPANMAPLELDLSGASAVQTVVMPEAGDVHSADHRPDALQLKGEIDGAMAQEIAAINGHAQAHKHLSLDCGKLHRIDFVAAGQLLNALAQLRVGGATIELFGLNHLVAALLVVMGISEVATLTLRKF